MPVEIELYGDTEQAQQISALVEAWDSALQSKQTDLLVADYSGDV